MHEEETKYLELTTSELYLIEDALKNKIIKHRNTLTILDSDLENQSSKVVNDTWKCHTDQIERSRDLLERLEMLGIKT